MSALSHIVLPLINFAVFVSTLIILLKKQVRVFVSARRERFKLIRDDASRKLASSDARLKAISARHEKIDAEIGSLLKSMSVQGERERETIIESAKSKAERIREDAKRQVRYETTRLRYDIYKECVEAALDRAEANIKHGLANKDVPMTIARRSMDEIAKTLCKGH